MIAASITIAEINPELAAKTINRSVEGMNHAYGNIFPMVLILKGQFTGVMVHSFQW